MGLLQREREPQGVFAAAAVIPSGKARQGHRLPRLSFASFRVRLSCPARGDACFQEFQGLKGCVANGKRRQILGGGSLDLDQSSSDAEQCVDELALADYVALG